MVYMDKVINLTQSTEMLLEYRRYMSLNESCFTNLTRNINLLFMNIYQSCNNAIQNKQNEKNKNVRRLASSLLS